MSELTLNEELPYPLSELGSSSFLDINNIFNYLQSNPSLYQYSLPTIPALLDINNITPATLLENGSINYINSQIEFIYGDNFKAGKLNTITSEWLVGDFSSLLHIEILDSSVFPTETLGAFSEETNKIYLNEELLSSGNTELITEVVLEETGHWLDKEINIEDTPGDEGQLFAAVVTGKKLSLSQIAEIKTENDTTTIFADGQYLEVEQATSTVIITAAPTITIAATDANAGETVAGQTANSGRFTLTRAGSLTSTLAVNYTVSGTATNGTDYNQLTGVATFGAGLSTTIIDLSVINDAILEPTETVIVTLNSGSNYNLGTTTTATVNIVDNDKPTITIKAIDAAAGETVAGQTLNPGRFTITRTGDLSSAPTVYYTVAGTAINGTDYSQLTGSATFASGVATAIIDVNVINDAILEGQETVIVTLASSENYTLGTAKIATVNIADNDKPTITIKATDASAGEILPGQTANPGRFTVTRTGDLSSAPTVNYTVTGTATNGTDYQTLNRSVTFASGSNTAIIDVTPIDDDVYEGTETVIVNLASSTNYTVGTAKSATVNLLDNDKPTITIKASDAAAKETLNTETPNPGRFTLTRTGNKSAELTVYYNVAGTATNGTDYETLTKSVTFAAGSATTVVDVTPIDDFVYEGSETVVVSLASKANYWIGTANSATVNLSDNDPQGGVIPTITISVNDANAAETLTGQTVNRGQFKLTRTGDLSAYLTVGYSVSGTAINGVDYNSLNGTATFAASASTALINVSPVDDAVFEGDETVVVTLVSGSGYVLGAVKTGTVTIADNDTVSYITVGSPNGGDSLLIDGNYNITWDDNISENVKIDLYQNGIFHSNIFSSTPSDGSETWTLPSNLTTGSDYQIKISSVNNGNVYDWSDSYFSLVADINTTNNWDGQNVLYFGEPDTATYGQTFTVSNPNNILNSFTFYVDDFSDPDAVDFAAYIMAWDGSKATGPIIYASDIQSTTGVNGFETFTFYTGGINLTPNQQYVAFLSTSNFFDGVTGTGKIGYVSGDVYTGGSFFYKNNGNDFNSLTTSAWDNYGGDLAFQASFANSPNSYIIVGSPNSGEGLQAGSSYYITWNDNIGENVTIDLYKGGILYSTLFNSTLSDGGELWTLPIDLIAGSDYQIKISSTSNHNIYDWSDGYFSITNFPINLYDSSSYQWDIDEYGGIINGTIDAYDGGLYHSGFSSQTSYTTEDNGREIVLGSSTINGLSVTRKIYVPTGESFARFLEIITNPTANAVSYNLNLNSNLGSDSGTVLVNTSSGDTRFTTSDNWIITDDTNGSSDPTLLHVFAGNGGAIRPSSVSLSSDSLSYGYNLNLQPGQTRIIMHFAAQNIDQATALSKANSLNSLGLNLLAGMSTQEIYQVANFNAISRPNISLNQTYNRALGTTDPLNPSRTGSYVDEYRLTGVSAGQQVRINLDSSAFDAYLQVVNAATGEVLATNDDSNGSNNSQIDFTVQSGVNYVVRATSFSSGATGNYTLSAISPYITVSSPNGGNTLQIGSTYNLTWADNISENVNIDLYKGGVYHRTIFSSTLSDGSESWILPSDLIVGSDYQIKITSVNNSNVYDWSNNYFTVNSLQQPDLVIQSQYVPSSITVGSTVNVEAYTVNQGTATSGENYVRYWLSDDTTLNTGTDRFLGYNYVNSLGVGYSEYDSFGFTYDSSWGTGTKYIFFEADGYGYVAESNESNNLAYATILVTQPSSLVTISNVSFSGYEGDTGTFQIRLNQAPTSNVSLSFNLGSFLTIDSDNNISNGTQDTITFTSSNWNTNRTVWFIAEKDSSSGNRTSGNTIGYTLTGGLTGTGNHNLGTIINTYATDSSRYNIDLDFRNDYEGFWTSHRRSIAQQAANDWASRIANELSDFSLNNRSLGMVGVNGVSAFQFTTNRFIDDLVVFVGSYNGGDNAGGWGGSYGELGGWSISEPLARAAEFTVNSLYASSYSDAQLYSIFSHELGHGLGLLGQNQTGSNLIDSTSPNTATFRGEYARVANGGSYVALQSQDGPNPVTGQYDYSHPADRVYSMMSYGWTYSLSAPTNIDYAMLADIGYRITGVNA